MMEASAKMETETEHVKRLAQLTDEAAIVELTRQMSQCWDNGDAEAYGELFGECSDYVAFDGTRLTGRAANIAHHRILFETVLKGTHLVFEGGPTIRFISADLAIMHAMGSVLMTWQDHVLPKRRSIQTYAVHRTDSGCWRIEAFHNSRYRPMNLPRGQMLKLILAFMRLRTIVSKPRLTEASPARN